MTVTVYRSTDASAPQLSGQAGSVVAILDACLVNGYGSKSAAGWGKPYSSTNIGVYRSATGNRHYLRVDDTAAQEARIVGYEAMSTVSPTSSEGAFPMPSQVSGGLFVRKSESSDSVARSWILIASEKFFYFLPNSWATSPSVIPVANDQSGFMAFGEINSYKPGDTYHTLLMAAQVTGGNNGVLGINTRTSGFGAAAGHFMARNHLQFGNAIAVSKTAIMDPTSTSGQFGISGNYPPFPDSVMGGLNVSPVVINESGHGGSCIVRGVMPGLWAPLHASPMVHYDTVEGAGNLAGKTLQMIQCAAATVLSRLLFEISDTW